MLNEPSASLIPLLRCPACGYALTGLPNAGRCPECGDSYDNETLVLFGWPHRRFKNPGTTALYILAICVAIFLFADASIVIAAIPFFLLHERWTDLGIAILFALAYAGPATGLLLLAKWLRRRARTHVSNPDSLGIPSLQLRLTPFGYACRRGYGSVQYLQWIPNLELDITHDGSIAHVRIARLTPVGTIDWSTVVDIAFPSTADQFAFLLAHINVLRHPMRNKG